MRSVTYLGLKEIKFLVEDKLYKNHNFFVVYSGDLQSKLVRQCKKIWHKTVIYLWNFDEETSRNLATKKAGRM
jgi:hypothetical protein